jgi:hypothetical protein
MIVNALFIPLLPPQFSRSWTRAVSVRRSPPPLNLSETLG